MATISTFEILVKRIAPLTGNANVDAAFRRVVQGYFLTLTNPGDRRLNFRIRAQFPRVTAGSPFSVIQRELVSGSNPNHIYTYDITGGPNNGQNVYEPLRCRATSTHYRTMITRNLSLEPGQTAAFKLLPDITSSAIDLADPQLEVRGFLEIVQLRQFFPFQDPLPADLIMTPEIRGTFLDNTYPFPGGPDLDFDQIAYALPTCTGAACVRLAEVEYPFILCLPDGLVFDPDGDLTSVFPYERLEKIPFQEDYQGRRYLGDEGFRALEDILRAFGEKVPKATVNAQSVRRQIEDLLNDERFSPRGK